jgi:hypothetical protein
MKIGGKLETLEFYPFKVVRVMMLCNANQDVRLALQSN